MKTKKTNPPAMTFGSKEWNEYYGLRHGSRRKGDRAERAGKALRQSLTKKGEAKHLETRRKELEQEGARLAKAQQAEDRAESRILGPEGRTRAVKIARPSGTFGPEDVQAFLSAGWEVHPAGSVSAKTGLTLGALAPWDLALNPQPDFPRLLGPQQAARALVLAAGEPVISSDTLHELRRAGYDVAAAPKGLREGRKAATNPAGPEKRTYAALVKAAKKGEAPTAGDLAGSLREPEEAILDHLANLARKGLAHPVPGGLFGSGWAPGIVQPSLAFNPRGHVAPHADTHAKRGAEAGTMTNAKPRTRPQSLQDVEKMMAAVLGKQTGGAVEVCARGTDRWTIHGKPGAVEKAVAFMQANKLMTLESKEHDEELGETFAYLWSGKTKRTNPTKSGRGASPRMGKTRAAKRPQEEKPRPETSKVQPLKSPKAARYRAEKAVEAILDQATKKPKAAAKPKGTLESATLKIRFNPGSAADVERVWKAWTGAKPGQVLKLNVEDPSGTLPEDVALLGRVSRFIQPDGALKDFGDAGPLMVTDGKARQVWLLHPKGFTFNLTPSLICYLAKKPKFGDRDLIEYVHAFERPAKARMEGQVGTLTGGFKLTPRGIEG